MTLPAPDDLGPAPVWENYVVAQLTQASLGLIPEGAVALGVRAERWDVTVVCQLPSPTSDAQSGLDEIAQELHLLLGAPAKVTTVLEPRDKPLITPNDSVVWTFAAHGEDE